MRVCVSEGVYVCDMKTEGRLIRAEEGDQRGTQKRHERVVEGRSEQGTEKDMDAWQC